jgi:hypothetical protein
MKNIIIVGYPKSGNTWIARLTAELVGCPVIGFWGSDHNEMAREGEERKSDYGCFKSHHQLHELNIKPKDNNFIIYTIRDPRDITISGANFFTFNRYENLEALFKRIPKGELFWKRIVSKVVNPESYRIDRMMYAVINGSSKVHKWCRISWKEHWETYLDTGCLFVRYEDMLSSPEEECRRILSHLEISRDIDHIKKTIDNQSFSKKKEEFKIEGEAGKAGFMRVGKSEQWKRKLTNKQKEYFREHLAKDLDRFSYET